MLNTLEQVRGPLPMHYRLLWPVVKLYERSICLAERSNEPYATHVPILVGVAAAFRPESIIELGSGDFSTASFLDEAAFPSIRRVDSYENNREWFEQVRQKLPSSGRVNLHFVEGEMYKAVCAANPAAADMIFIDDSPTARARVPTVEEVARSCGTQPLVILHDNDLRRLRFATRKFEHRVSINTFNPQCSVMWHGHPERAAILQRVGGIIRDHGASIPVTDIRGWAKVFSQEL
jgi:predicted O-methyltransferase YrrM